MAWFEDWFDSKYYHILYKNRDLEEASMLIDNLVDYLQPKDQATMLDLGCGKGRHSLYLANKGFSVTGVDLSIESIQHAQQFERSNLSFYSHDMRHLFRANYFDYIFNFFTSFGYFPHDREHLKALQNVRKGLKKDGVFGIDFFNSNKVIHNLIPKEEKSVDGVDFNISRKVEKGIIIKNIQFSEGSKKYEFEERVRAFTKADLESLLIEAGLIPFASFGDYGLQAFDQEQSNRLILLAKKA